jgi:2-polyprenyl-6-methoxyphenol hydroxylase-like FAD-dependent oxidoreductase
VDGDNEVLIVGAGPVGLALGLELQRFGVRFRIVEKKAARSTTSKAMGLQPRLSEVFAVLGVADQFFRRGFSNIRAVNVHSGGRKLLRMPVRPPPNQSGRDAFQPRMLIIPQSVTEEILDNALLERGCAVERCREVIGFEQHESRVEVTIRSGDGVEEKVQAKFVVSCEGAHSLIRKQSGFSFSGVTMPLRFLLADVTLHWDEPEDEVRVFFHRDGVLAALPFGSQKWRLIIECADDQTEPAQEVTLPLVQNLATQRTRNRDIVISDPVWLSDFRINARMVDRFRDRRMFVAGDAAHIHSPLGGQGIATGIQDAGNLAWKLAAVLREGAPDSLLDTYGEERRPIARQVLRRTSVMSHIVFGMNPVMRFVRERLVFPILRTDFAQARMTARMSQLEMNYRESSLAELSSRSARVRAGDRAPDVLFKSENANVSLFDLLGKFGMIALLGSAPNNQSLANSLGRLNIRAFIVAPRHLEDIHSDFARLYSAQGSFLYLIRPDGHVGLFQREAEAESVTAYLKKIRAADDVERAFGVRT